MASLVRSAKSGSDWTASDRQSPVRFYGRSLPSIESLDKIDPDFLNATPDTMQGLSDQTYRLLQYLDLASRANSGQESAIDDFAKEILRTLGYEKRGLLLRSRYAIPLVICGDPDQKAQSDVCLVQGSSTILLVVQEDKTTVSARDPEPQVIAEAIATFQCNNRVRARLDEPQLDSMIIPCITMIGTRPIFYLVPVTRELSEAVATARYPRSPTVVKKCIVAPKSRRLSEGMEIPSYRRLALQHYAAFHTLAESHWSAYMIQMDVEDVETDEVEV